MGALFQIGLDVGNVGVPFWTLGVITILTLGLTVTLREHGEDNLRELDLKTPTWAIFSHSRDNWPELSLCRSNRFYNARPLVSSLANSASP